MGPTERQRTFDVDVPGRRVGRGEVVGEQRLRLTPGLLFHQPVLAGLVLVPVLVLVGAVRLAQDEADLRRVLAPLVQHLERALGRGERAVVVPPLLDEGEAPRAAHGVRQSNDHVLARRVEGGAAHHPLNPVHPHFELHHRRADAQVATSYSWHICLIPLHSVPSSALLENVVLTTHDLS